MAREEEELVGGTMNERGTGIMCWRRVRHENDPESVVGGVVRWLEEGLCDLRQKTARAAGARKEGRATLLSRSSAITFLCPSSSRSSPAPSFSHRLLSCRTANGAPTDCRIVVGRISMSANGNKGFLPPSSIFVSRPRRLFHGQSPFPLHYDWFSPTLAFFLPVESWP
ncbi:hypothetical protein KSP40_PGU016969 [Platanthera guangdongensis]|uniref:Uncharacterized protein n=1 Tax=Platanthera guangdongensis TaxID=2320717 RepID=A0ABR2MIH3_9ASPA